MGDAAHEALGSGGVGGGQDADAFVVERWCAPVVDGRRRHQADPGMAMHVVVPVEERMAEGPGVYDRAEALGGSRAGT